MMKFSTIQHAVEAICDKGCRQVRADILTLEQGRNPLETVDLGAPERAEVLRELKSIMAVYGDQCRIE